MGQRVASLQKYLASIEVRADTKASLALGVFAGLAIIVAIAAFPGKPIDYSGVGESNRLLDAAGNECMCDCDGYFTCSGV